MKRRNIFRVLETDNRIILKWSQRNNECGCALNSSQSGSELLTDACELRNENLCSTKGGGGESFNILSDYGFLIKDCYVGLLGILFGSICADVRLIDVPVKTIAEAKCEFNIT